MLEDVRAARLAGLRMVVCDQIVIGSFCGQARNVQQTAEMRGFVVRASLVEKRSIFKRARRPPLRTRRLTFLKAGRGHTTSSSSAMLHTIAKWTSEAVQAQISHETASTRSAERREPRLDKDGNLE